jgi:DsbC/DsbD-like thiol-disulfide interchange protein
MLINSKRIQIALKLIAMLAAVGFVSFPAFAATSDWASSEGGRMRVVALSPDADGTVRAGLQIEPKPGWITYWREPGQSGIPPQLTVTGDDVTLKAIAYPVPKPLMIGSIEEIGYDGPVTLPLDLKVTGPAKSAKLDLTAFIGICRDICIPFQASFSLPLPEAGKASAEEFSVLNAATASLPQAPTPDFSVLGHTLSTDGKTLALKLALPDTDGPAPRIYITGPSGYAFFRQANGERKGTNFDVDIALSKLPKNYDIHGKSWGILVVSGNRAMETTLAFE